MQDITMEVNELADRIHEMRQDRDRLLVAVTGAPASGKSTLAAEVSRRLTLQKVPNTLVPMDGFHLDNDILDARDLRQCKGAPETFDVHGLLRTIAALRAQEDVVVPRFDRTRDIAIAGAVHVSPRTPVVLVEGNYLMFDEDPWRDLASQWDLTARIATPLPELRARLIQRWLSHNFSRAAATRRAESNDIPNAHRVADKALPCDMTFGADG